MKWKEVIREVKVEVPREVRVEIIKEVSATGASDMQRDGLKMRFTASPLSVRRPT